jgi:hypothetical protein
MLVHDGVAAPFARESTDDACGHFGYGLWKVDGFSRGLLAEDVGGEKGGAYVMCW